MPLDPPPLTGLKVLELAGLAPVPFASLILADYGASVIRIDPPPPRPSLPSSTPSNSPLPTPPPAPDLLTRHKSSLSLNLKHPRSRSLFLSLLTHTDILLDPFRPGVLERLHLSPTSLLAHNPRLIIVRLVGFRRDGPMGMRAGHDINYLAASGLLSMLGRAGGKPTPPGNLLADFGGGGLVAVVGCLMALLVRERTGRGQVVEACMEDGVGYLGTMARLGSMRELDSLGPSRAASSAGGVKEGEGEGVEAGDNERIWTHPLGHNLLDSGCAYYDTYATADNKYMSVGALEPQFFSTLLSCLQIPPSSLPGHYRDRKTWPFLRQLFTEKFKEKTRREWEEVFEGRDACCTPVLTLEEMRDGGYVNRPLVTLRGSPGLAVARRSERNELGTARKTIEGKGSEERPVEEGQGPGVDGDGWTGRILPANEGGEERMREWTGWTRGVEYQYDEGGGGWVLVAGKARM